jgi:hypothetical protein
MGCLVDGPHFRSCSGSGYQGRNFDKVLYASLRIIVRSNLSTKRLIYLCEEASQAPIFSPQG